MIYYDAQSTATLAKPTLSNQEINNPPLIANAEFKLNYSILQVPFTHNWLPYSFFN